MSGYRKFTEEELERARDTNMLDFLSSKGYSFKPSGKGYKCKEHDSLVINGDCHRWYWNSCAMGGHSAIDFCIKIEGMTFPEALHHILGKQLVQTSVPTQPIQESFNSAAADIILPKAEKGKYKRLFGYLCMKRKIDPQGNQRGAGQGDNRPLQHLRNPFQQQLLWLELSEDRQGTDVSG